MYTCASVFKSLFLFKSCRFVIHVSHAITSIKKYYLLNIMFLQHINERVMFERIKSLHKLKRQLDLFPHCLAGCAHNKNINLYLSHSFMLKCNSRPLWFGGGVFRTRIVEPSHSGSKLNAYTL